jgi:hypothetical protein
MLVCVAALSATLLMRTVASFPTQILPVLVPLITVWARPAPESIGNPAALVATGDLGVSGAASGISIEHGRGRAGLLRNSGFVIMRQREILSPPPG